MSYSPFHKISRHEKGAEIITVKDSPEVYIKGIKYRKAQSYNFGDGELDHYLFSQAPCNKLNVSNTFYVEIKPHKCEFNCIDSQQTDTEWIQYLRDSPNKRIVENILKVMARYGYSNTPQKGYKKVG
jgi:hypothetical protein